MPESRDEAPLPAPRAAPRVRTVESPTILTIEEILELGGITAESLPGTFEGEGTWLERFRPNPAFIEFLQGVICTEGPSDPDLQAAARKQGRDRLSSVMAGDPMTRADGFRPRTSSGASE